MSVFNFSAGPAMLPQAVMQKAQQQFIDWQQLGCSVMEVSHRSTEFIELAEKSEASLRKLMNISDDYSVLFMHGGGRGQFAAVPMNLHVEGAKAEYFQTGAWSKGAIAEANRFTQATNQVMTQTDGLTRVIPIEQWQCDKNASYAHYCPNETIEGIELFNEPNFGDVPLVADMSSTILSRQIDVSKYGLIYAGAQKNIGPSGLAIVIVRNDLLQREGTDKPSIMDYQLTAKKGSMYNTPPTYAWYLASLVFDWLESQGGLAVVEQNNKEKAATLYDFIDNSAFYSNNVAAEVRSRMNVPFFLKDESLNNVFLSEAEKSGLLALKGHRDLGGMRASIYNAMPIEGVRALVSFMKKFEQEHA